MPQPNDACTRQSTVCFLLLLCLLLLGVAWNCIYFRAFCCFLQFTAWCCWLSLWWACFLLGFIIGGVFNNNVRTYLVYAYVCVSYIIIIFYKMIWCRRSTSSARVVCVWKDKDTVFFEGRKSARTHTLFSTHLSCLSRCFRACMHALMQGLSLCV